MVPRVRLKSVLLNVHVRDYTQEGLRTNGKDYETDSDGMRLIKTRLMMKSAVIEAIETPRHKFAALERSNTRTTAAEGSYTRITAEEVKPR